MFLPACSECSRCVRQINLVAEFGASKIAVARYRALRHATPGSHVEILPVGITRENRNLSLAQSRQDSCRPVAASIWRTNAPAPPSHQSETAVALTGVSNSQMINAIIQQRIRPPQQQVT